MCNDMKDTTAKFRRCLTLVPVPGGGLRVRRRPHRLPRGNKERRTRGSIWLQSPLMGLTAEDSRQQAMSREEEEANISTNSISSSIDSSSSSSNEDSDNSIYRSGDDSMDYKSSSSEKEDKVWNREELLQHQQQLVLLRRREGLLDITMRTVNLMRRNQQLQHRLAALQAETRAFVRSVLNNPENQAIREMTSRSRRKFIIESEDNECSNKRIKSEDESTSPAIATTVTTTTTTTITTTTTTSTSDATTLSPSSKIEQDPSVSEGDGDK